MNLKEFYNRLCTNGIFFPYAFDPTTKKPSITLLMLYFATLVMFSASITNLFLNSILIPTLTTVMIWVLAFVFYRIRSLDRFKINLEEKSIELEDLPDSSEETGQKEKDNE